MKAVEFQSELNPNQTLNVPVTVANQIPPGQQIRVLVLIPEGMEDQDWEQLTALEFGQEYADSDAIFDKLSTG